MEKEPEDRGVKPTLKNHMKGGYRMSCSQKEKKKREGEPYLGEGERDRTHWERSRGKN